MPCKNTFVRTPGSLSWSPLTPFLAGCQGAIHRPESERIRIPGGPHGSGLDEPRVNERLAALPFVRRVLAHEQLAPSVRPEG